MLDQTLPNPFFGGASKKRNTFHAEEVHQTSGIADTPTANKVAVKEVKGMEVDYIRFSMLYWPRFDQLLTSSMEPSLVCAKSYPQLLLYILSV